MKTRQIPYQPLCSQKYLSQKLSSILEMDISQQHKIKLVEGFLLMLKQQQQQPKYQVHENASTYFSESPSYQQNIEQLEEKILERRAIKFLLNQQIQGTEEDLFQKQKTVNTKRQYNDKLRKQIQSTMQDIEVEYEKIIEPGDSYVFQSLYFVTKIIKGMLS